MHVLAPYQFSFLSYLNLRILGKDTIMTAFLISLVLLQWVEGHSTSPHEFTKYLICCSCVFLRAPQSDAT